MLIHRNMPYIIEIVKEKKESLENVQCINCQKNILFNSKAFLEFIDAKINGTLLIGAYLSN
jgi:hypothetical protein